MSDFSKSSSITPVDAAKAFTMAETKVAFDRAKSYVPEIITEARGRMVLALDARKRRSATWGVIANALADVFKEAGKQGGLALQMVSFSGFIEFAVQPWQNEKTKLVDALQNLSHEDGGTQLARVISHIRTIAASQRVKAAVLIVETIDENVDFVYARARELAQLNVPLIILQEGGDQGAEMSFRDLARITHGAYATFDARSPAGLQELLVAAAVFAVGGKQALTTHARTKGGVAQLLSAQLH